MKVPIGRRYIDFPTLEDPAKYREMLIAIVGIIYDNYPGSSEFIPAMGRVG